MPAFRQLIRSRFAMVLAGLGLGFATLTFVVTIWHDDLGFRGGSVGLALLLAGVAMLLTVFGALLLGWAMRPVEGRLRVREQGGTIEMIISDVVMPRLNRPDLIAALRREGYEVPVLFATGYASSEVLCEHQTPGGARFIEKPWTVDSLARQVREVLDGRMAG